MENRIMRIAEVVELTGTSESTIWRWVSNGQFVKPIKLTPRSTGWLASEVNQWLESKVQARDMEV